jgi:hypothetical protein
VWFAVLEEAGLQVQLVNSSQARNLPGRPKTDKEDARWIARLTEMGMLRPSFVPPPEIRALRVHTRLVFDLTADRTRCWQRLEKLLEDALCKLSSAVSKLAGHVTARAVIEAMIAGERDPRALASLGRGRMSIQRVDALEQHAHARLGRHDVRSSFARARQRPAPRWTRSPTARRCVPVSLSRIRDSSASRTEPQAGRSTSLNTLSPASHHSARTGPAAPGR